MLQITFKLLLINKQKYHILYTHFKGFSNTDDGYILVHAKI